MIMRCCTPGLGSVVWVDYLIWMADITAWAAEVVRLLKPGGAFFVHESHPAIALDLG